MAKIVVSICREEDMARACAIFLDANGLQQPVINESYPRHCTVEGRRLAVIRHSNPAFRADPRVAHLKLVDPSVVQMSPHELGLTTCDPFIGYGRWIVKRIGEDVPHPPSSPRPSTFGDWWPSKRDKDFVAWARWAYEARRLEKLAQTPREKSVYCTHPMAMHPIRGCS